MKELITIEQMNHLMMAFIVIAPVVGLVIGAIVKNVKAYGLGGLAIGVGNYILWTVYSAITNKLGLDTVANLAVNLGLFIVIGVVVGIVIAKMQSKPERSKE
jgi:lipopolysaccharide export LptBFGC system permease protein LptF